MTPNTMLGIFIATIGIVIVVCPYDKIKMIFPKARSEKVLKAAGIVAAMVGIIAIISENVAL